MSSTCTVVQMDSNLTVFDDVHVLSKYVVVHRPRSESGGYNTMTLCVCVCVGTGNSPNKYACP